MRLPQMPPLHTPFSPGAPVRSLQDVERHEARPLAEALPVQSTYEIFVNSAAAFGDKTALSFLPTSDPADEPIRWSYAQLLTGIHQTANLLHHLGVGPQDAVAVLLPGCLEYHLALWGGEAAGIVQPLNPMLTDEKIAAMMTLARAKVLIAYGGEGDVGYWSKALRLRALVPTLTTVLRVAPHPDAPGHLPFEAALGLSGDADPALAGVLAERLDPAGAGLVALGLGGVVGQVHVGDREDHRDLVSVDRHLGRHDLPLVGQPAGEPAAHPLPLLACNHVIDITTRRRAAQDGRDQ